MNGVHNLLETDRSYFFGSRNTGQVVDWLGKGCQYLADKVVALAKTLFCAFSLLAEKCSEIKQKVVCYFNPPSPVFVPEKYPTLREAWNAPVPPMSSNTQSNLIKGSIYFGVFAAVAPIIMLGYTLSHQDIQTSNGLVYMLHSYHSVAGVYSGIVASAVVTYWAIDNARDLSYRTVHVIHSGVYQCKEIVRSRLPRFTWPSYTETPSKLRFQAK